MINHLPDHGVILTPDRSSHHYRVDTKPGTNMNHLGALCNGCTFRNDSSPVASCQPNGRGRHLVSTTGSPNSITILGNCHPRFQENGEFVQAEPTYRNRVAGHDDSPVTNEMLNIQYGCEPQDP
ncbi:hypothetical protein GF389_00160 [Candidatus Dojkabacteria bacterium]|nr:hypothetical protein [Candidatus Dojkabacteria bacterium]